MRTLTDHIGNPVNDKITVTVIDPPGVGNASHLYEVLVPNGNPLRTHINFQNGPIGEVGVNGLTQEVLLAIVVDRLRSFQEGDFACYENEAALMHASEALRMLHARTAGRIARGVEGLTKV